MAMIDSSIQYLKGVGPAFAKKFEKLGVTTIRDLLLCYPRKYIDYTQPYTVTGAPYDADCCVRATVLQKEPVRRIKGGRALVRVLAADDSGVLGLSWFNTPYVADKLIIGETYYFEGRVGGNMTHREMLHPMVRTEAQVAACPFVAVYPGTEGLPAARQAACAHAALQYVDELADPLPPGRKPIKTWYITGKKRRDMYGFIEKQIAAGHQAYVVCPAIEENEMDSGMQAVKKYYTETVCPLLPNRRIGLLHGKMKPKEKDEVMLKFKAGELDVLVSTTVIEVGVDVPNATVMVIENAERFGLSALHQLRGRVGRGAADSCCILISDNENDAVKERLRFLCHTSDGFAVAKYDLENRGPGDFFGSAQHGLPTLRVADLVQDTRTLKVAQEEAKALLAVDPNLVMPEHRELSDEVERLFATAGAMN